MIRPILKRDFRRRVNKKDTENEKKRENTKSRIHLKK